MPSPFLGEAERGEVRAVSHAIVFCLLYGYWLSSSHFAVFFFYIPLRSALVRSPFPSAFRSAWPSFAHSLPDAFGLPFSRS